MNFTQVKEHSKISLKSNSLHIRLSNIFLVISTSISFLNLLNGIGLYPRVMNDEWYYSMYSRNIDFNQALIPNFFYMSIMKQTSLCTDQFLACGRLFNFLALVAAAFIVRKMLIQMTSRTLGNMIAGMILVSPLGIYVNYYMPEMFYFLFFIIVIYCVFKIASKSSFASFLGYIVSFAFFILIKPHALFLIPSFFVATLTAMKFRGTVKIKKHAIEISILLIFAVLALRTVLGYFFAGNASFSFFGGYTGALNESVFNDQKAFLGHSLNLGKGLMFPITLIFGFSLFVFIITKTERENYSLKNVSYVMLRNFTFVGTVTLIPIIAILTTVLAGNNAYELTRVHERYVNFFFPVYLITFAVWISLEGKSFAKGLHLKIAIIFSFAAIILVVLELGSYSFNAISSPFSQGLLSSQLMKILAVFIASLLIILFLWKQNLSSNFYFFLVIPVLFFSTTQTNQKTLEMHRFPYKYDQAGIFAQNFLLQYPERLNDKLLIVAPEIEGIYEALMKIDRFDVSFKVIPAGESLEFLGSNYDLVLTVGDYPKFKEGEVILETPAYSLINLSKVPLVR